MRLSPGGNASASAESAENGGSGLIWTLNALTMAGCSPRRSPDGYNATCPVRGDNRRRMNITTDRDGQLASVWCGDCGSDHGDVLAQYIARPSSIAARRVFRPTVDSEALAWLTMSDGEERCCTASRWSIYPGARSVSKTPLPCGTWDCRYCGEANGRKAIADLIAGLRREPAVYVVVVEVFDKRARDRFKKSVNRAGGSAVRVDRKDHCHVLCNGVLSVPITGSWMSPEQAVTYFANVALHIPGVDRQDFSGRWRRVRQERRAAARLAPLLNRVAGNEIFLQIFEAVADKAQERWGVRPTPELIPEPIDVGEFAAVLGAAIEVRGSGTAAADADDAGVTDRPVESEGLAEDTVTDRPSRGEGKRAIGDSPEPSQDAQGRLVTEPKGRLVTPPAAEPDDVADDLLDNIQQDLDHTISYAGEDA